MMARLLAWIALASAGGAAPGGGRSEAGVSDSAAIVARVRAAETRFFVEWRKLWMSSYNDGHLAQARLAAVHCHHDGSYSSPAPNLIRSLYTRRSMCPIWYVGARVNADEREGRDLALTPNARARARALREPVLAMLDSAAALLPHDRFITGQRVRLYLDHGDVPGAAAAARACRGSQSWCGLLAGLVLHRGGLPAAADSAFQDAMRTMTWEERCTWNDISELFDGAERRLFRSHSCDAREAVVERFWWLADPLFSEPWNERRAEHFARKLVVQLHRDLPIDERWDWNDDHGADAVAETLIRYGWPSFVGWGGAWEDRGHFQWLGFTDSSVNVSAEYMGVRVHTAPPLAAAIDARSFVDFEDPDISPQSISRIPFADPKWWAFEHFARGQGALVRLPHHRAVFRRDGDALVYVAIEDVDSLAATTPHALILSRGPRDGHTVVESPRTGVSPAPGRRGGTHVLSARTPAGAAIVSVERSAGDTGGVSGRARFGALLPAGLAGFPGDSIALSDLLLFSPPAGARLPERVEDAAATMLGSTALRSAGRLGLFWEMYGVPPDDSVEVSLRITQTDEPGLLRRLGTRLGLVRPGTGSIALRWNEPQAGNARPFTVAGTVPVQTRAVVTDVSRLDRGHYLIELSVRRPGRDGAAATRRVEISVP